MKKILTILLGFLLILSLVGCSKGTTNVSPTPKAPEVASPIVGTWKYYKDVPKMPSFATWTLEFNKDGTYTTTGDIITGNSESKSHAETWGAKGKYTVSEDSKTIAMIREDKENIITRNFEIKDENGEKQLIFKDDSGEISVATIGEGKTLYYTIFIKQN